MINNNLFHTIPKQETVLPFLADFLSISPLVNQVGISDFSSTWKPIELVCISDSPPYEDFRHDVGGSREPIALWLLGEILDHLKRTPNGLVLLEDIVSEPDKETYTITPCPSHLFFEDEVFWPIHGDESGIDYVEKMQSWCSAFQEIYLFTKIPSTLSLPLKTTELDKKMIEELALSTTRIITDVFQGGGYLDWKS